MPSHIVSERKREFLNSDGVPEPFWWWELEESDDDGRNIRYRWVEADQSQYKT